MWIPRYVEQLLHHMARQFPAVLVTGVRQAGKTSLLRHLYPQASYLSLDLPAHAEAAQTAPEALLAQYPEPVIIDEIQYAPSLLRHLKVRIDQNRSPGRYLLTGSQLFPLMQGVSESLAGRCAVLNLHTLSRAELLLAGRTIEEPAVHLSWRLSGTVRGGRVGSLVSCVCGHLSGTRRAERPAGRGPTEI